jgi:hypothetical protein
MNNNIDLWSYFAGQALNGILSRLQHMRGEPNKNTVSKEAAWHADYMMEEWKKRQPNPTDKLKEYLDEQRYLEELREKR